MHSSGQQHTTREEVCLICVYHICVVLLVLNRRGMPPPAIVDAYVLRQPLTRCEVASVGDGVAVIILRRDKTP